MLLLQFTFFVKEIYRFEKVRGTIYGVFLSSWYTSIHETRDVCQRYLNEVKKEVESLERQRKLLKSQPTTKSAVTLHAEKSLQDDNEEEDIKNNETGVNHPSDKVQ